MDYSKFLDENFDVKDWVNTAFRSHKEGGKDQYATTLVMKLQMFIQEVNNVIEESCQQAVQNLPRVARELDAVKQEASLLKDQMTMVKHDIEKVEQDTAQSMQMLLKIDSIKSRMKDASDALREADNWTTLSADVDDVFESGDINAMAAKLVGMKQSLQVLVDVPDYTERCQYLEMLKNRLEATLSPQIVSAFNSQSLDAAKMFVKIFTDIDRLPQLTKYFHKCQKGNLLQSWRDIKDQNVEESLVEWLPQYYDVLLSTYHSQVKWCSSVFLDPVSIVCQLLTESLEGMDPSLSSCIETHLQDKDNQLQTLIDIKQISERFAKSIEGAIESHSGGNIVNYDNMEKLAAMIYAPYKCYVAKYESYEEGALTTELNAIRLDHTEIMDTVRLLANSVSKLFVAANKANDRCCEFTNGVGYVGLLRALQNYFTQYVSEFRRVVTNLREKCKAESTSVDSDDWTWFQHSLRVIQTCGDLIMHCDELDQSLVSSIVSSVGKYYPPTSPSLTMAQQQQKAAFQNYQKLLLENVQDQRALENLITMLEEGDTPSVFDEVKKEMISLSEVVHKFAFDIVFAPLQEQISHLHEMEIWTSQSTGGALTSDLPNFSLSPQEYITKVGQYLMTLPQQLEPFTLQDNPQVTVALKYGKLPYTTQQELPEHLADLWLESLARGTMHHYSEQMLKIIELSSLGTRQLITDIDYLSNVLDDLGLHTTDNITNVATLLKTAESEYQDVAENMPQRLVSAISHMRNLKLD